jgi:crotonobetainyl-CoA:carnitine CoA-transferase CaiB-like acyl-CoA transferase
MLCRTGGDGNPPDHYLTHMDYGCGLTSSAMVLAALVERERSGVGQYLEVPQTGAGLLAMSDVHGHKDSKSETFPLDHEQRGHAPTNALYRTADGWLVIACYSDREWDGVRRGYRGCTVAALCAGPPGGARCERDREDHRSCTGTADDRRRVAPSGRRGCTLHVAVNI